MVLASYLKRKWEAERNQQFLDERRRNKASMRKWAEKRGIPIDELPERGTISWHLAKATGWDMAKATSKAFKKELGWNARDSKRPLFSLGRRSETYP